MGTFWNQLKTLWGRLETPQRASMVLIAVVFAGVIAALAYGSTRPSLRALATGLDAARTAEIAAYLESQGVDYRIADRERTVLVPAEAIYRLRTQLAEQELLTDGSTGFELLNEGGLGDSSFKEQKNYDRAVAGELERSFRSIPGVEGVRVIVNRPKPSPFLTEETSASASVSLRMRNSRLSDRQLSGVVHLTAGAVEGLMPEQVQVMDQHGLLTRPDEDPAALQASDSLEAEKAREAHLTAKAQELLDRVLGPGRGMVEVAVDLDFTRRSESRSQPTAGVTVRETTSATDEATPIPSERGLAGTATGVEGEGVAGGDAPIATRTTEDTSRDLAVGRIDEAVENEVGVVRGMTVSILVDYKTVPAAAPAEGAAEADDAAPPADERVPYTDAEMEAFRQLVLGAIGYDAALGHQLGVDPDNAQARFSVSIQSMPLFVAETDAFEEPGVLASLSEGGEVAAWLRWGVAAIVALTLLMVARGQLRRSHDAWQAEIERRREEERARIEAEANDPERLVEQEQVRRAELRDRIREQVQGNPNAAATILKNWLSDA